ncbi:BTAD domain-containing putative transcriptional regulator [Nocardioides sediminis]|uniref:BTAD domain-containing putative transcriptional regulator n=1 Tax=Nocardioides sediminis TaxID=433648 RepID=UPI000D310D12|nr:BTAD domain-containing putative transcriptional regulator [Nocardioides sediminis]
MSGVHTQPPGTAPRFGILGPLQVCDADGRPVALGGPRARQLLALLLLHPHRPLSSELLVTSMWGESPSEGAATTLRTHVAAVRRVLAAAGADGGLVNRPGGYALLLDRADLDAEVFEDLVDRAREALGMGDPARAAALLRDALSLWRGEVLSDLGPPDFAETTVARLGELRVVAEEAAMAAALELGQHREVVGRLQELVAAHPFHERLCGLLVLALYRSGRQADALAAYATTRQRLGDELGIDPGPELQALETAVLRQDPALLLAVDATTSSREVGPVVPEPRAPVARQPSDAVFAALRRSPMVGRDAALATATDAWGEVRDGGRGLLALGGPAGVGKSRLAAELAHHAARDGATVLVGRCDETVPYAALSSALGGSTAVQQLVAAAPTGVRARLHPLLPLEVGSEADAPPIADPDLRAGLVRGVEWLLAALARDGPVLLVVEDAERLTAEESDLLAALATRLPEQSLVLVCFRDPPGTRHAPLAGLLGRGGVHEMTRPVSLSALDRDDLADLVASLHRDGVDASPALVEALWERTGGNPFFAREVLRDLGPDDLRSGRLGEDLPTGLRGVLRHRLRQLGDETLAALSAAAVLGREVELARLGHVLEEREERVVQALERAVSSGFLVEAGQSWAGGYAFQHDLLREAVHGEIPLPRRQRLHQRAVAAVLGAHPADADVIAAAGHAIEAGPAADPAEAAALVGRAVDVAAAAFGFDVAVRLAEARLGLLDRSATPTEQAAARVDVARLRLRAGRGYDRVVELLESALGTFLACGDTEAAGMVHTRLGGALVVPHAHMDVVRALEHFRAAERMLPSPEDRFGLHRGRLSAAMHALDTATMAAAADRCHAIAEATGRVEPSLVADWGRGWLALDLGHPTAALAHLETAWSAARALGDPAAGWPPSNAAALICTVYLLDPDQGRSWCRRGLGQPRVDRLLQQHDALTDQLVLALATTGELDVAQRAAARLPEEAVGRRLVRFLTGEWEEAADQWQAALDHDLAAGDRHDAVANARWLADALLALGEDRRAAEVLHQGLEIVAASPQVPSEVWLRARLAGLPTTPPDHAAAHLARCEGVLAGGEDWRGLVGEVALARGRVALRDTDWTAAEAEARRAAEVFGRHRVPWRLAASLRVWAAALEGAGRVEGARARRADAEDVLTRAGAPARWRRTSTPPQRARTTLGP